MINQTIDWIDDLVEEKKLNPVKAYDLKLRLHRAEGEDQLDREMAVSSVKHDIRQAIENGGVGFAVLSQSTKGSKIEPLKKKNGQR